MTEKTSTNTASATNQTTITKRQATGGKVINLHQTWKGIAECMMNKADRRHYINMMLDATRVAAYQPKRLTKNQRPEVGTTDD